MKQATKRALCLMLVLTLLASFAAPVGAVSTQQSPNAASSVTFTQVDNSSVSAGLRPEAVETESAASEYADTDAVRVSIVLEEQSTIEAGYPVLDIAENTEALAYRSRLQEKQEAVTTAIERQLSEKLDVVWNLTLAANIISANVKYGQIEAIEAVPGVAEVLIETRYEPDVFSKEEVAEPNMGTSSGQISSPVAWASGYTGAGTRIAIIDTGTDVNHQSFDEGAYQYSLAYWAGVNGLTIEEYQKKLDLLDAAEIASVADQLNVSVDADQAYINSKVPFGYNYIDEDYDILHINDTASEHGSHVSGIAAANAYIPAEDGTFERALDTVMTQGVAPDAQILTLKVFGKNGGAYDSDYMAAIEDAIVLGADAVNLSLGSTNPGRSRCAVAAYQTIMENLTKSGAVVTMSAGNSGSWVEKAFNSGLLYAQDVSMQTHGSPGSYTNSLSVASVDNCGTVGYCIQVGDSQIFYNEYIPSSFGLNSILTLAGEQEYIFIDGFGTAADFAAVGDALVGKIAVCSRGSNSFYQKANAAVEAGAIATIIYENQPGLINMNMAGVLYPNPCVSISQTDGALLRSLSTPVTAEDGTVLYYTGKMTIRDSMVAHLLGNEFNTVSSFSSWGVPGTLELKPEIAAPGGKIYSVYGETTSGGGSDQYETMSGTSMASPQMAGMAALVAQYIRENELETKTGLSSRQLAQSLLMSTAVPMYESAGAYYPVIRQGAGLANVGAAVSADSYILMDENATASYADGKVKAELGDDPERKGEYTFSFTIHNLEEVEKNFVLSADFFIQTPTEGALNDKGDVGLFMGTTTTAIGADVTWQVDGIALEPSAELQGLDFNGDSVVNSDDGQALLDYATGVISALTNQEKADLDADGDIDTYDAYLFLSKLTAGTAAVAADGSVQVTVTAKLSDDWKEKLDSYYPNGTYIQGYVYAESMASDEGCAGTVHSIPVLAFFGNWTDPSMFDVGTYQEYAAGDEVRTPYLGSTKINSFLITYHDEPTAQYFFGGNPMVPDETYLPERNAINSENGDMISQVVFTNIRNASAGHFLVTDKATGETLAESYSGTVNSAYYYVDASMWFNTEWRKRAGFTPADAAEGDAFELSLTLAPEYYVDAEGKVDWDALGRGATLSTSLVVDNTAPVLEKVALDLMNNELCVTASDNQYVAAVALYNKAGNQLYTEVGSKPEIQPGEEAEYVLDLSEVNGKQFLLQVFDYAMNVTTYLIEMQIGEEQPLPEMIMFSNGYTGRPRNHWTTLDQTAQYDREEGVYAPADQTFNAAAIVDHIVLAATETGDLYVMPETDLTDVTLVDNMGAIVDDMAYNKADGKLYGVAYSYLVTIDKLTAELTFIGEIGVETKALACDANGTFYCSNQGSGAIYSFTLDTLSKPKLVANEYRPFCEYVHNMEIDPNTGLLCFTSFLERPGTMFNMMVSYYYEYDLTAGKYIGSGTFLMGDYSAMIIPDKSAGSADWADPTDKVGKLSLSASSVKLVLGGESTLTANVLPWTVSDRTITWSSADESVATVDDKGTVTAVSEGVTTVTVTSNLDPSLSASCTVTVDALDVTVKGALMNEMGNPMFFSWNMGTDSTWTAGSALDTTLISAAYNPDDQVYYIMDDEMEDMHKVGEDGVTVESAANTGSLPLWDMAYSEYFTQKRGYDVLHGIYQYYLLAFKDPMNLDSMAFDLRSYVSSLTAITSLGREEYKESDGNVLDTEHIVLLDDIGRVINFWVFEDEEGTPGAYIGIDSSDLPCDFSGFGRYMYTSMVAGNDGALYVSSYNGATNELYRMVFDEEADMYISTRIGDMGNGIWPAAITEVTVNTSVEENAVVTPEAVKKITAQPVSIEDLAAELEGVGTKICNPSSDANVGDGEKTITIDVTTDVAATNGLTTVTYDASKLALESAVINGTYTARVEEEGKLTFGYVSMTEIPAEGTVATLTFKALEAVDSTVTVEHKQVNNAAGATETLTVEFEHTNTEVRDAIEVTCTTAGYTGDTWCLDCGQMIEKGQIIQATGHSFGDWVVTKEANCTEQGEEARTCANCGETETRAIEASDENCPCKDFTDLDNTQWYHEGVDFVLENGLMKGMTQTTFAPNGTLTRAQLVTVLYRMAGEPSVDGLENPFTDVNENDWFADAVIWAYSEKVVNGMSETTFAPNADITREQIAAIMYRYSGAEAAVEDALEQFTDASDVSGWAAEAMNWAVASGLITGMSETTLAPTGTATRAQIAAILMRYCEKFN